METPIFGEIHALKENYFSKASAWIAAKMAIPTMAMEFVNVGLMGKFILMVHAGQIPIQTSDTIIAMIIRRT